MSEEILINGKKITELSDMFFEYCKLQKENEKLKENQCCPETCEYIATEIIRYTNVCEVNSKYRQALEEIRDYASVLYGEPLIEGSKLRLRSGMYRIKSKINEVLKNET